MFQSVLMCCALTVGQAPVPSSSHSKVVQFAEVPSGFSIQPIHHDDDKDKKEDKKAPEPKACGNCATSEVVMPCNDCGCEEEKCGWCDLGEPFDVSTWLLGEDCKIDFGGWTTVGYHSQTTGAPGNPGVMFNNAPDAIRSHQSVLYVERAVDGSEGIDFGFRVSALYGIDAIDTQAFGNRPGTWDFLNGWGSGDGYGTAIPELYLETALNEKLSIKGGRFYTVIGYETVTAVNNFFYSHAFTFFFSEPFTHTGVLATYKATDKLEMTGGWVAGNDTAFQLNNEGTAFLGIVSYQATDNLKLSYALNFGDLGFSGNGYHHTILADVTMGDNWNWVLQNDIADTDLIRSQAIVNYLFYTVNDCVKVGTRAEWWRAFEEDYYEITFGVNLTPQANIRLRPELRYQWSPDGQGAKNAVGVTTDHGLIFGIDAVITF